MIDSLYIRYDSSFVKSESPLIRAVEPLGKSPHGTEYPRNRQQVYNPKVQAVSSVGRLIDKLA